RGAMAEAVASQIAGFIAANPFPDGIHWASGQEVAIRLAAWGFAWSVLRDQPPLQKLALPLARAVAQAAIHIERNFELVERVVYNNHLISEAAGLLVAAVLLPAHPR